MTRKDLNNMGTPDSKVATYLSEKVSGMTTLMILFFAILITLPALVTAVNAQVPSTDIQDGAIIQTWSEPEAGTLYTEILIYANFCSVIENNDLTESFLNITSILKRPDGQTEQLDQFADVNKNNCEQVPTYSFIPQLPGDHTVHLVAHIDNNNVSSNPVTVRIVSEGIFQSGKVTVVLDSEKLRAMNHAPDPNYAHQFRVLDWSRDGKFILFMYHDYAAQMDSLGIIDVKTYNATRLDVLNVNENNTERIYLAKFSPSSDSVLVLLYKESQYPAKPENIFKYDLENRTLSQITNTSSVYWFDTLTNADGKILIYIDSTGSHFWPNEDEELGELVDRAAGKYYYYLPRYLENAFGTTSGSLDIKEDASKLVFTGPAGGLLEPGMILVDVQSGGEKKITSRNPCVSSVEFAPNDNLILYSEHPEQLCLEPSADLGASLRIASLDGAIDEIVYNDKRTVPNAVLSPDGRFVATVGNAYSIEDQFPKILILELPRPVPEFGSFHVVIAAVLLFFIVVAARFMITGRSADIGKP